MPKTKPAPAEPRLFHVYGDAGPDVAMASQCLEEAGAIHHASARDRYGATEPGISVREGMSTRNWEFFRPGDAMPRRKNEVIAAADNVYRYNGIVQFVINMMADFVCQGMQIYHPAASKERRYRHWWKKVQGQAVSERLVNGLYRHGVSVVKRNFATLNRGDLDDLDTAMAAPRPAGDDGEKEAVEKDIKYDREYKPGRNRIPLQYTFLNPATVEIIGGELAIFAGKPQYGLKIPEALWKIIRNPKPDERYLVQNLPNYVTAAVGQGKKIIPLDDEKVSVHHYKKDDWQLWPDPLILSILDDLLLYKKMKEADKAALDGIISQIRLWTLGLPEHKIQPGPGAFAKLRDQLLAHAAGGSMDLIWDATLKLQQSSTDAHKFLGSAKYEPVLQAIFAGLGIPQSLTGGGGGGGMTNNALSLKTLIERLQHARNILVDFWEREFYLVQRAFGDRQPARLRFDLMSLSDEAAEKMLWVQLFDRDIASLQTTREKFGMLDDVEAQRTRREYKGRTAEDVAPKLGPFSEAAPHPGSMQKAAMQQGTIAPTEAGVKKLPKARGDKSLMDHQAEQQDKQVDLQKQKIEGDQKLAEQQQKIDEKQGGDLHQQKLQQNDELHRQKLKQGEVEHRTMLPVKKQALKQKLQMQRDQAKAPTKGDPAAGRPKGAKDASKRKARTPVPRTGASLLAVQVRAREFQRAIAEAVTPAYLERCGRKNLRGLSSAQADELESLKFRMLCGMAPESACGAGVMQTLIAEPPAPDPAIEAKLNDLVFEVYGSRGLTPSVEELREMQASAYAAYWTGGDDAAAV